MLNSLSGIAQQGIRRYCSFMGLDELAASAQSEFSAAAHLWFIMRAAVDNDVIFPRGKWATLQAWEQSLNRAGRIVLEEQLKTVCQSSGSCLECGVDNGYHRDTCSIYAKSHGHDPYVLGSELDGQ